MTYRKNFLIDYEYVFGFCKDSRHKIQANSFCKRNAGEKRLTFWGSDFF